MLTTEEKIIDYFARRRVNITKDHARYLIKLVREDIQEEWCKIEKYQYRAVDQKYELLHVGYIEPERIQKIALNVKPVYMFYKYVIYKPDGTIAEIFTKEIL